MKRSGWRWRQSRDSVYPRQLVQTSPTIPGLTFSLSISTTPPPHKNPTPHNTPQPLHSTHLSFPQWQLSLKPTHVHLPLNAAAAFSSPAIPKPTTSSTAPHDPWLFVTSIIRYKSPFTASILIRSPSRDTPPTVSGSRRPMSPARFVFGGRIMIMFWRTSFEFSLVGSMIFSGPLIARGSLRVEMERENLLFAPLCN